MALHDLSRMDASDAYDETQMRDDIRDGDIIRVVSGVVIMVQAWPVLVWGDACECFQTLAPGFTWDMVENGKYADAARQALALQ
ncbi:MAG: hypothetical protein WBH52_28275 [Pseudomonas aeruginosa]